MKRAIATAISLVIISTATPLLLGKGITTRIKVTGLELQGPIEIDDPEILSHFNVWTGPGTFVNGVEANEGFIIDWASQAATDRPRGLPTYEVSFYVRYANQPLDQQADQLVYVVSYEIDPTTGQGYVYLPGKTDARYRLNTTSIYRGREGNWFRATPAWQNTLKASLERQRR